MTTPPDKLGSLPDPPERKRGGRRPACATPPPPTAPPPDPAPPPPEPGGMTGYRAAQLRTLLAERARRRVEALRLYEPLPAQLCFHAGSAPVRLARGSNRSGKTLSAAVEVAWAVTGRHPTAGKYPAEGGRCFCVGKDLNHLGQVMWRKLGRAGAFKMIRDAGTQRWRAFRPWEPGDADREHEARPAPPLIPPRLIREVAWENKKEGVPNLVRLHNGWELSFFSSLGKPPQGSDIDLWWFDEEIVDPEWFPEMTARTLDRRGKGVWSATPQAGTDQLYELHERAQDERGKPRPAVEEFVVLLADNPHIREDDKRSFAANLSPEDQRVRVGGEFALTSFKIYPEFSMLLHGVDWFAVPDHWCRYVVVDPGHQVCAVLFAALPPPGESRGDGVYLYDELYIRECDANKFAGAVAHKAAGQTFQAFVIDPNMAIYTEVGRGRSVGQQYADALRERNVASLATGSNFLLGSDNVEAGLLAVRGWMRVRDDGTPKLRVLRGALPNFEWEVKRYHRKRVAGQVTDKPDQKRGSHLMDCLRYLALYDPRYVKPSGKKAPASGAVRAYREKKKRRREAGGGQFVRLGPGGGVR